MLEQANKIQIIVLHFTFDFMERKIALVRSKS